MRQEALFKFLYQTFINLVYMYFCVLCKFDQIFEATQYVIFELQKNSQTFMALIVSQFLLRSLGYQYYMDLLTFSKSPRLYLIFIEVNNSYHYLIWLFSMNYHHINKCLNPKNVSFIIFDNLILEFLLYLKRNTRCFLVIQWRTLPPYRHLTQQMD